jgi:hypothetical protein
MLYISEYLLAKLYSVAFACFRVLHAYESLAVYLQIKVVTWLQWRVVILCSAAYPLLFKRYVLHKIVKNHQGRKSSYAASIQGQQAQRRMRIPLGIGEFHLYTGNVSSICSRCIASSGYLKSEG